MEECAFTIVPIEGMEKLQKNFAAYQDGEKAAYELLQSKKLTLARRFQLIERGYVLKLKDNGSKPPPKYTVHMIFGGTKHGGKETKQDDEATDDEEKENARHAN